MAVDIIMCARGIPLYLPARAGLRDDTAQETIRTIGR